MTTTVVKTIGATGRDYATHALWIAGAPSNLVTADQVWAGKSYNDAVFTVTSQINISGITTDATRYVDLDVGPGQGWVSTVPPVFGASQSRGILITCATAYQATLANNIVNFQLHNHQITNTSGSNRAAYSASTGSTTNIVENCIFESTDAGSSARYGITRNSLSVITGANSSPAWDCDYSQSVGLACLGAARPSGFTAAGTAYTASSGTTPMHDCWSAGFTTHSTSGRFSGSNNATTAATLSFGSGNVTSLPFTTATFKVVVNTNHDYKLVTGSSLVDAGVTDTTDIPASVDAVGTTRPQGSAWDIGPYELPVAGGATAGTCAGAATLSGATKFIKSAAGSLPGVATTNFVGRARFASNGTIAGAAVVNGATLAFRKTAGTCVGAAIVAGFGRAMRNTAGSCVGAAVLSGATHERIAAAGTCAGVAALSGVGKTIIAAPATCLGAATLSGHARGMAAMTGHCVASSSANGITSGSVAPTAGACVGVAVLSGFGAQRRAAAGTCAGVSSLSGVGKTFRATAGACVGVAVVNGAGHVRVPAAGSCVGTATLAGVGRRRIGAAGTCAGVAVVLGVSGNGGLTPAKGVIIAGAVVHGYGGAEPMANYLNILEGEREYA